MSERLFNPGGVGLAVETVPGTPLTPTDFMQAYDFSVAPDWQQQELDPAAGNAYGTQQVVQGLRKHGGDGTFIFEPNTVEKLVAMMLNQTSRTGAGPYTGTYGISATNPPGKTYTIDVFDGVQGIRHFGCEVSKLSAEKQGNEWRIKPSFGARGTFDGREVSSYTSGSPNVITLKTDYDPNPTTGLVIGDNIQYVQANGTITNLVVSLLTGTTVSTTPNSTTISGAASGDWIRLKAPTPSFTMLTPSLWSNSIVGFGTTASVAATNATVANQTRLDDFSWEIEFPFNDEAGEHRSGGNDPSVFLRKPGKVTFKAKKYFDTQGDLLNFNSLAKSAAVIRHIVYSGATTYEFKLTLNHMITKSPVPKWKSGEINYAELEFICQFDSGDGQAFSVITVNANATLT